MKIELNIPNTENITNLTPDQLEQYKEIMVALIQSGGLSGVRGGQTIIHFDQDAVFMGVQLSYWPWKRKKALNK